MTTNRESIAEQKANGAGGKFGTKSNTPPSGTLVASADDRPEEMTPSGWANWVMDRSFTFEASHDDDENNDVAERDWYHIQSAIEDGVEEALRHQGEQHAREIRAVQRRELYIVQNDSGDVIGVYWDRTDAEWSVDGRDDVSIIEETASLPGDES